MSLKNFTCICVNALAVKKDRNDAGPFFVTCLVQQGSGLSDILFVFFSSLPRIQVSHLRLSETPRAAVHGSRTNAPSSILQDNLENVYEFHNLQNCQCACSINIFGCRFNPYKINK
ncbi:hypothetical protein AAC387_Pa06g0993 [Persea americana]